MGGKFIVATALLLSGGEAWAQDGVAAEAPAWDGVWRGTVGGLPVHVCLQRKSYEDAGAYYYNRHRALIRLRRDGETWREGHEEGKAPAWTLSSLSGGAIEGRWSDGRRTLPVRLQRVDAAVDEEGPCATDAFHRSRLGSVRVVEKSATFAGQPITRLSFRPGPPFDEVEVASFTVDGGGTAVAKVNAELRSILPDARGGGEWLDCMKTNAAAHGSDGDYQEEIAPVLLSHRWLSARHQGSYYCAGAHPVDYRALRTFDLRSGGEVDVRDWFLPRAVHVEPDTGSPSKTLTAEFRTRLLQGWKPEDPECDDVLRTEEYWNVGVERGALVFSPTLPRVVLACSEDFKLTFAEAQPWLNAHGKAAVATLPR